MKTKDNLSVGTKIFVAVEGLLMLAVAIITIVSLVCSPIWQTSVFDGVLLTIILIATIGLPEWLFTEMILDVILDKD